MPARFRTFITILSAGLTAFWLPRIGGAFFSRAEVGTTAVPFLADGPGGRPAGMAGAYCAVADEASAVFWNPAGLAGMASSQILAMHAFGLDGIYQDYIAYAHAQADVTLGMGIHYQSMPALERLNDIGQVLGSFQPNDIACRVAAAVPWRDLQVGGSAILFRQELDGTAVVGGAVDLGIRWPWAPDLAWACKLESLGPAVKFVAQSFPLPTTLRTGLSWLPATDWIVAGDLVFPLDNVPSLHLGAEYRYPFHAEGWIVGRLGFQTATAADLGALAGLACGLGWQLGGLMVDYAFQPMTDLGSIHRLSLTVSLAEIPKASAETSSRPSGQPSADNGHEAALTGSATAAAADVSDPVRPGTAGVHAGSPEKGSFPGASRAPARTNAPPSRIAFAPAPAKPRRAAAAGKPAPQTATAVLAEPMPQDRPEDLQAWAEFYYQKALAAFREEKYYTAGTYGQQALRWSPQHAGLQQLMGELSRKTHGSADGDGNQEQEPHATPAPSE